MKHEEVAVSVQNVGIAYPRHGKCKRGEDYWAIKGLSFDVYRGETLGIIGRNGAGKSSLLRTIAGIIMPDSGRVDAFGNTISILALRAGFLGYLSGRDNIVLSGMLQGLSHQEVHERMEGIIEFSGIRQFIDDPVGTYSAGMNARLGFSIAIHVKPDVLLIDEALGVGDEGFKAKSTAAMKSIISSDRTVVFVSHVVPVVEELCDRVLWIDKGEMKMLGDTREVLRAYRASVQASKDVVEKS